MQDIMLRQAPFVLLDDSRSSDEAGVSYLYHSPEAIIAASCAGDVASALKAIDEYVSKGYYVAGFCHYEMAAALEDKLVHIAAPQDLQEDHVGQSPLLWMVVTRQQCRLTGDQIDQLFHDNQLGAQRCYNLDIGPPSLSPETYRKTIEKIQAYIKAGDVYQINFTFPIPLDLKGDSMELYKDLRRQQPVPYGAYIHTGEQIILSFSPELFVRKKATVVQTQPMKGTAPRGVTTGQDMQNQYFLKQDSKSKAENLMIVDLLRNDISRLTKAGTVHVPDLFTTAVYKSVIQMTSVVEGEASAETEQSPASILKALFPCGSVTGAPKIRAMEIIHELESPTSQRGVYCGAIGHFVPEKAADGKSSYSAVFNVPIRTLTFDQKGKGIFHTGSGIVDDSQPADEYDECLLKAKFLSDLKAESGMRDNFHLFETIRLTLTDAAIDGDGDGIGLRSVCPDWSLHMARLSDSARYFQIPFDRTFIESLLLDHLKTLLSSQRVSSGGDVFRLKLVLNRTGQAVIQSSPFFDAAVESGEKQRVQVAKQRLSSADIYLYHKSNRRSLYDKASKLAQEKGLADVIFLNERDEVCEGAISSLFIRKNETDGCLYTPVLSSGLLPGTLRARLLSEGKAKETVLYLEDIQEAAEVYIGNSLRGLRSITLDWDTLDID